MYLTGAFYNRHILPPYKTSFIISVRRSINVTLFTLLLNRFKGGADLYLKRNHAPSAPPSQINTHNLQINFDEIFDLTAEAFCNIYLDVLQRKAHLSTLPGQCLQFPSMVGFMKL